ncbi:MAG: hypothetical protein ACFB8W_09860 [Elainellaceae cyanobacterium]
MTCRAPNIVFAIPAAHQYPWAETEGERTGDRQPHLHRCQHWIS